MADMEFDFAHAKSDLEGMLAAFRSLGKLESVLLHAQQAEQSIKDSESKKAELDAAIAQATSDSQAIYRKLASDKEQAEQTLALAKTKATEERQAQLAALDERIQAQATELAKLQAATEAAKSEHRATLARITDDEREAVAKANEAKNALQVAKDAVARMMGA